MIDYDLAELYEVPTKRLNEQVKRNIRRFPEHFMFELTKKEKDACRTWVNAELLFIKPKVIIPLGKHALERFFPDLKISSAHGQVYEHSSKIPIFPIYHPAAALYNPNLRDTLKKDFQELQNFLKDTIKIQKTTSKKESLVEDLLKEAKTGDFNNSSKKVLFNPFQPIKRAIGDRKLRPNYIAWFLFGLAATSMQSVFSLYLQRVFNFGSSVIGLFLSGMGVVMVLNQGVGLKHFWLKYFSEPKLESDMLLICGVSFLIMSVGNLWVLIFGLLISVLTQSVQDG
jgi:hypothetical protein